MGTSITRFSGCPKRWLVLLTLCLLALSVAACGENPPSATPSGTVHSVTITEKTGTHDIYSFDPQNLSIKVGDTVKWVNNSDENHLLASNSSGIFNATSIVPRSGSSNSTYQVVFNTAGTYNYSSTLVQRLHNQIEGMPSSAMGTITVTT